METSLILSLASIVIATGTFILSLLIYRRNARIENENHLFKQKLDVYREIIGKMWKIISLIEDYKIGIDVENPVGDKLEESRESFLDKLERAEDDATDYITTHALIIPEKIVNLLNDFLFNNKLEDHVYSNDKSLMEYTLTKIYNKGDKVHDEMQEDLNVKGLNRSLFRRIK